MDINPIQLVSFAKEASDKCVHDGMSLNDAIAKIAETHELNPMQIRRVAELANHDVQGSFYKGAEDKSFTFELADPGKIVQMVQSGGHAKVAAFDVVMAALTPPRCREEVVKLAAEIVASDQESKRRQFAEVHDNLEKIGEHIQAFRREMLIQQGSLQGEISESLQKIGEMAKDHIIMNKGQLSDFFKFACQYDAGMSKAWKGVFEHIKDDLMKLGAPVDKSLISDNLEMPGGELEIINGGHTLAIELDTLKNKISEEDKMAKNIRLMDTFGEAVVDKMRILRTPEDVDKQILEDTWRLSKSAEVGVEPFMEEIKESGKLLIPGLLAGGALGYGGYKMIEGVTKGVRKKTSFAAKPYQEYQRLHRLS